MADSIFRPTYHSPVYEPATYSTKDGKRMVRFRLPKTGKYVTGELFPNGKARVRSPLWHARIRKNGKVVKIALGVTDKEAALQLRAKLQLAADQQRAGMIDPFAEHRGIPLTQHIQDYQTHLEANGCSPDHITESVNLLERICLACSFRYIEEFMAPSLNTYLAGLIRKGRSYRTRNKSLHTIKALVHWLQNNDRMDTDPFRTVKNLNEDADPNRRLRRALTAGEFMALVTAAESGRVVQGTSGPERALIYSLAVTTGLRAREVALLCIRDLVLDADCPYIALPPAVAKAKRGEVLPLHPVVADKLVDWVGRRAASSRVFPSLMTENGKMRLTNRMMRSDCKAAGIPYKGDDGFADFHALRTTFITNTCRLTDQFTAMKLARHTKAAITARHYDKVQLAGRAKVVRQLMLPAPKQTS